MPIKSQAQRRKLWATDPKAAQKLEDKTSKSQSKKLPEKKKKA